MNLSNKIITIGLLLSFPIISLAVYGLSFTVQMLLSIVGLLLAMGLAIVSLLLPLFAVFLCYLFFRCIFYYPFDTDNNTSEDAVDNYDEQEPEENPFRFMKVSEVFDNAENTNETSFYNKNDFEKGDK